MEIEIGKKYRGKINGAIIKIEKIAKNSFGNTVITFSDKTNKQFHTTYDVFKRCLVEEI